MALGRSVGLGWDWTRTLWTRPLRRFGVILLLVGLVLALQLPALWTSPAASDMNDAGAMRKLAMTLAVAAAMAPSPERDARARLAVADKDRRLEHLAAAASRLREPTQAALADYRARWEGVKASLGDGIAGLNAETIPRLFELEGAADALVQRMEADALAQRQRTIVQIALTSGLALAAVALQLRASLARRRRDIEALAHLRESLRQAATTESPAAPDAEPAGNDTEIEALAKTVDHAFRDQLAAAGVARQSLQELVDNVSDGIISIDSEQRLVLVNRAAGAMFGIDPQRAIGMPLRRLLPPQVQAAHTDWVETFRQTGGTRRMASSRRLTALRSDGEPFDIEVTLSVSGDAPSRLMTAVVRNVTTEHALEDERVRRIAMEVAADERSRLMGFVAHEVGNALMPIQGGAQLLQLETDASAQRRHVAMVAHGASAIQRLMKDLLDLARAESNQLSMASDPLDAATVAREVAEDLRVEADAADVTLEVDVPAAPCWALGDPQRLRQCLMNLTSNGIKYNRAGGVVALTVTPEADVVRIDVTDTGVGLTDSERLRLFTPFDRLSQAKGPRPGAGLGLALTRRLIEQMGGALDVHSVPGRGSAFGFSLPAAPGSDVDTIPSAMATAPTPPAP